MLMNNLDPDVAERPDDLVVYGGTGKAARSWAAFDAIVAALRALASDETLLVQSGKPVAVFRTSPPRAARADRQRQPGAALGDLGHVPRSRGQGPDDVRPDDGRQLDLHRHAGHPAGHLRDARRGGAPPLRRQPRRPGHAHRRPRRHGRRPAARGDDERRRGAGRRGGPVTRRAPAAGPLPRRGYGRPRGRARPRAALRRPTASRARSAWSATPRTCCPSWCGAATRRTSSPIRPRRTIRSSATSRTG